MTSHLLPNLVLFGRVCKAFGLKFTPDTSLDAAQALEMVGLLSRDDVHAALRAVYVKRERDLALFDRVFAVFWRRLTYGTEATLTPDAHNGAGPSEWAASDEPDDHPLPSGDGWDQPWLVSTYSGQEVLRHKDFDAMTPAELSAAYEWIARLDWSLSARRTRRYAAGKGPLLDLRRAARRNLRYGGELLDLPRRAPVYKRRSLLVLGDISGSMARYTRVLLHLMYALAQNFHEVEAFVFGTRLTRITPALRQHRLAAALDQVGQNVQDWSGGTRIGEALHTFNRRWRWRAAGTGTIVLLITDGWDRGDPELLRREMALLRRSCYRLIWLNPLLGLPDYEPLTRGAQAMIGHVDDFLPVHNLASLETLVHELGRIDWQRPKAGTPAKTALALSSERVHRHVQNQRVDRGL